MARTPSGAPRSDRAPPPRTPFARGTVRSARMPGKPARPASTTIGYQRGPSARQIGQPRPVTASPRALTRTSIGKGVSGAPGAPASPVRPLGRAVARARNDRVALLVPVPRPSSGPAAPHDTGAAERPHSHADTMAPARLFSRPLSPLTPLLRSVGTTTVVRAVRATTVLTAAPAVMGLPRVRAAERPTRRASAPVGERSHAPKPRSSVPGMPLLAAPRAFTVPPAWSAQTRTPHVTRPSMFAPPATDAPTVVTTDVSASMVQLVERTVEDRVSRHIRSRSRAARALATQLQKDLYESLRFERERLGG